MTEPKLIKDVVIYDDVTLDDLATMLENKTITLSEFYKVLEDGKFESDTMRIYKKKINKK